MRRGAGTEGAAATTQSVEHLREEHGRTERVLSAVEALVPRLRAGDDVAVQAAVAALHFFADFLQRCHEAKEEEILFPLLGAHGLDAPRRSLTILRAEHARGHRMLERLRGVGVQEWKHRRAIDRLAAYTVMLRRHVAKEEEVLFPWAERVMTADDDVRAAQGFAALETRQLGSAGLQALEELATVVEQTARTPRAGGLARGDLLVEEVMSHRPRTIGPDESLAHAAVLMEAVGSRELPVAQDSRLVGILSALDMRPHQGHFEWTPVRVAMTRDPVTVTPDMPIGTAARILVERCFNSVPVLAGGALVGMVRRVDLLRLLISSGTAA